MRIQTAPASPILIKKGSGGKNIQLSFHFSNFASIFYFFFAGKEPLLSQLQVHAERGDRIQIRKDKGGRLSDKCVCLCRVPRVHAVFPKSANTCSWGSTFGTVCTACQLGENKFIRLIQEIVQTKDLLELSRLSNP